MALDPQVLTGTNRDCPTCLDAERGDSNQRRLNLEMSVRNLQQSFEDRERVPKIQGLLNELMTFLEDDLSIITGAYDDLLSLDEVIDKELILFVSLEYQQELEGRHRPRPHVAAEHATDDWQALRE